MRKGRRGSEANSRHTVWTRANCGPSNYLCNEKCYLLLFASSDIWSSLWRTWPFIPGVNIKFCLGEVLKMHNYNCRIIISTYLRTQRSVISENGNNSDRKHFEVESKLQIARPGGFKEEEGKEKNETRLLCRWHSGNHWFSFHRNSLLPFGRFYQTEAIIAWHNYLRFSLSLLYADSSFMFLLLFRPPFRLRVQSAPGLN